MSPTKSIKKHVVNIETVPSSIHLCCPTVFELFKIGFHIEHDLEADVCQSF